MFLGGWTILDTPVLHIIRTASRNAAGGVGPEFDELY
jgi:hypothetical protein